MTATAEATPISDRELVLTSIIDAPSEKLFRAWEPSEKPFMTVILTFENEGKKTRYTARVRHWTVADRETHEEMGFHQGWGQCADQLAALVAKL
jgi:uncharacterized protein YndB with AHSA1/START domain